MSLMAHRAMSPAALRVVLMAGAVRLEPQLHHLLDELGCEVQALDDAEVTPFSLSGRSYDLVVLDARLTPPNRVLDLIGSASASGSPVVVVAPGAAADTVASWIECGADGVISEPLEPRLFVAIVRRALGSKARHDAAISQVQQWEQRGRRYHRLSQVVIPLGVALSSERDYGRLLETIVLESMAVCNADGGTLYLREGDDLAFQITRNSSLGIATGGTTGLPSTLPSVPLYHPQTGLPNHQSVASCAALSGQIVNVADAYEVAGFDFSGTRRFDALTGYRSTSFLTCPLVGTNGQVIGVLQLINAQDESSRTIGFDADLERVMATMSSLAVVALEAHIREERLRRQIADLRIEIDQGTKEREVAEITTSSYFLDLMSAAREYRDEALAATPLPYGVDRN